MDNIERYPQEILDLVTPEGFNEAFDNRWDVTNRKVTQEDVYDELEELYIAYYGRRRYKDFRAFRRARQHYENKQRVRQG